MTDEELEQTIKRIERLNRILTGAVLAEVIVLVLFI
jgi:heme A synthase